MPSPTPRWVRTSRRPSCCGPTPRATPKEIRQFAIGRIADFKVPRQVLIVKEIPKGPTGKMQRVGLAAKLGLAAGAARRRPSLRPRTPLEKMLAGIWAEILQLEQVGIDDDFFALGGDSLLATHVLTRIYDIMHLEVEVIGFFEAPTVAEMAHHLETLIQAGQARRPASAILRVPREDGGAGIFRSGAIVEAATRAAGHAFFQYPLCASPDVAGRRGRSGAEHQ